MPSFLDRREPGSPPAAKLIARWCSYNRVVRHAFGSTVSGSLSVKILHELDASQTASLELNIHHTPMPRQIRQSTLVMAVDTRGSQAANKGSMLLLPSGAQQAQPDRTAEVSGLWKARKKSAGETDKIVQTLKSTCGDISDIENMLTCLTRRP